MCGIIPHIFLKNMITNTIIICHDDYELIKKKFEALRRKWGLKYTHHYDTEYLLYHEWIGKHDKLEVSYIIDQANPKTNDKINWIEAWILYSFNNESEFFNGFKEILNIVSPYVYNHKVEYVPKLEIEEPTQLEEKEEYKFVGADLWAHYRTHQLLRYMPDNWGVKWK